MKKVIYILGLIFLFNCAIIRAQDYKTHRVKKGETVMSIAKEYKVTPFDIYKLNPDAKEGIKVNAVLIIPKSKVDTTPLETEQVFIGYKKHKVKRKETLYGLAKKYNITEEDIKKHNKFLYSKNLRKGNKLQIPIFKTVKKIPEQVVDKSIKEYTVLPSEGKWRVAYKFGISIAELERLNPEIEDSLKVGQIIKVPNIADNEERAIDESFGYYNVLPKEGFYRLKVKLGLTQEELERLNPELKESGLKAGMVLKIPKNIFIKSGNQESESSEGLSLIDSISNFSTKHLAVMLPFQLNRINSDSIQDAKRQIKNNRALSISLDFHSGVLMAIDSVKHLGVSTRLDVYDTRNSQTETSNIIRRNNFSDVDAVIGPLMKSNFEKAASILLDDNVPIISPITKEVRLYDNVFQSRPSAELMQNSIISYIKSDTLIKRVFIVYDSKNAKKATFLKSKFPNAKLIRSRKNEEGVDKNYVLIDDFLSDKEEKISIFSEGKNVVFLETKNDGFASNATSILNSLITEEKEIVLATTDKNKAFEGENISNMYLSNLRFHFPSMKKDFDPSSSNSFINKYKAKYGVAPNNYAIRGFDITMDVLLRLSSSESLFESAKLESETKYTENKFLYKKKLFGGYYNNAVYIIKYDDLKIVEAE